MTVNTKRMDRAVRSRNPDQRTAAARRALNNAAHKLKEVKLLIEAAAATLPGAAVQVSISELVMSVRPVEMLEAKLRQMVRRIEGYD